MNSHWRQLLVIAVTAGCADAAPSRVTLESASGHQLMQPWYGVFLEPLEGPNSSPIARLVVGFVDASWQCSGDTTGDAVTFTFNVFSPGTNSSTVLSRSGPDLRSTTSGSGAVTLSEVDDRYEGQGDLGPLVEDGGHVSGSVKFDFGDDVTLAGRFRAPHCDALDFSNSP